MSVSDSNVKSITVTGPAAAQGGGGPKKRRRTVRSRQEGGSAIPSESVSKVNVIQQLASQIPPTATSAPSFLSAIAAVAAPGSQAGGANKQKVNLVPAKNKNKTRVLLAPKSSAAPQQAGGAAKTRKQKKISLRVSNIRRKVASTRKHIHASTSLPIDKIRKELVDAKLLNPASKAPEALIRKIYADFKITTHKA
jgi:hypothetical protein